MALLQKLSRLFGGPLSEVGSTSDTISLVRRIFVRSWLGFRHHLAFLVIPCPKSDRLQTLSRLFGGLLSEVCSTSDTISLVLRIFVRSWLGFRHNLACLAISCPKLARLLTHYHLFSESLSEVGSTSGTISLVQRFLVRNLLNFRHNLACLEVPSPKLAWLQTLSRLFGGPLSEVGSTSDTILLVRRILVRIHLGFRHYPTCSAVPYPKSPRLPTLSHLFGGALSEVDTAASALQL